MSSHASRQLLGIANAIVKIPEEMVKPEFLDTLIELWRRDAIDAKLLHDRDKKDKQ